MRNSKGLSLTETLTSIAILSILIGVMVQIILLYNRVQRETGFLTTATLDAKEIGIKIERYMLQAKNIDIMKRNSNRYIYIIDCYTDTKTPNPDIAKIWYINNSTSKYNKVVIYDNVINTRIEKNLSKEIYMVLKEYNLSPKVIEVSFYVYNKYAKKYRNLDKKILAYYISIIKYHSH
jgi:hypothetical protein